MLTIASSACKVASVFLFAAPNCLLSLRREDCESIENRWSGRVRKVILSKRRPCMPLSTAPLTTAPTHMPAKTSSKATPSQRSSTLSTSLLKVLCPVSGSRETALTQPRKARASASLESPLGLPGDAIFGGEVAERGRQDEFAERRAKMVVQIRSEKQAALMAKEEIREGASHVPAHPGSQMAAVLDGHVTQLLFLFLLPAFPESSSR